MASKKDPAARLKRRSRNRQIARVRSLDVLIGAHPDSLRDIYEAGTPFDPTEAGEVQGRLLAIDSLQSAYMLTRPLVSKLARGWLPWRSCQFESGGTAGTQRFAAGRSWRFSAEGGPSRLDGSPTLQLRYAELGNPPWAAGLEQELRRVGDDVVIGPLFRGNGIAPSAWCGLTA